jgi:hypothetical protein
MMLRELSTVLLEMQDALAPFQGPAAPATASRIRLQDATLELPLDLRVVLADGGARLEADVPRSLADANWRAGCSRLRLTIQAVPWPEDDEEAAS